MNIFELFSKIGKSEPQAIHNVAVNERAIHAIQATEQRMRQQNFTEEERNNRILFCKDTFCFGGRASRVLISVALLALLAPSRTTRAVS